MVATGLDAPWSVVFRNGTALISERDTGQILELAQDGTTRVVGTVEGVTSAGEGGLLGMAVDDRGRLYVYSTASEGNRIERYELTGTAGSLGLGNRTTLIEGLPSAGYHDGGRIAFGPDGMLYATVGDAGQSNDAQDLESSAGKILRMTPDGEVPEDNPFPGSLVYSYGHRKPQSLAWADDGTLFIANLRGQVLRAVPLDALSTATDHYTGEYGRLRDVTATPDGNLWFVTHNTNGRGDPGPDDDRILSVDLSH